jgi:hypothetical protein
VFNSEDLNPNMDYELKGGLFYQNGAKNSVIRDGDISAIVRQEQTFIL